MKKWISTLLAAALCAGLTGCNAVLPPEQAADGLDWEESWITVGGIVGVDTPDGIDPRENNEALAANGMYYATWSVGEGEPYTNEDEEDALVYDVQIYLLMAGAKSEEDAGNTIAQWEEMARLQYVIDQTTEDTFNGQDFTMLSYAFDSETNPYARGVSAYGVYRNFAISVELACRESYDGDAAQLLEQFLDNCHYAIP